MDKQFPIVKVTWIDAESSDEWEDIVGPKRACKQITTVGFLIEDSDHGLALAMQIDPFNEKCSMVMTLPNHWVEEIIELKA